jgi:Putative DNA-binding domain
MKAALSSFQAFRVASRNLFPFAAVLAVLFTLCAFAQYVHVTHQNRAATEADLESAAALIRQEIAFTNSWNLTGFRRAEFAAGSYFVFTQDGLQIEMGEFIPGLIDRVALIDESFYEKPKTITTQVGEKWRLLAKRVQGGVVVLGMLDLEGALQDLDLADRTIRSEAEKFGKTLDQAVQVKTREVASKVDYAVVDDSGAPRASTSFIPLRLVSAKILNMKSTTSLVTTGGKSYFLLRKPILNASGIAVGQIVISKDVTAGERAVGSLVLFNLGLGGLCWLAVLLLVGAKVIAIEIEKRTLEISLEEALRQGEGQTIEFKTGISVNNLPPVISAFANTNPGVIFVGVQDDREVCGLLAARPHEEERIKQQIRDIVQNRVDPLVIPILKYFEVGGKKVLRVSIPLGDRPPYLGNDVVYRRVLAAVVPARADDIRKMR